MILKPYQKQILSDLDRYLNILERTQNIQKAFEEFWVNHPRTPIVPTPFCGGVEPYKNNIAGVPHLCFKVPTAGGKTFIAANALKVIFDNLKMTTAKMVVWLVPSNSILEQTLKNLSNASHPYREQLNADFSGKVEVYDKKTLLQGANFNSASVQENLSICVLSFDSLRARKKEDRKVYQENGNLQTFASLVNDGEVTLMKVLQKLNPVVIVDESHNAESELSVEMLRELNPSLILDLTATPRKNSNILSFTSAIELKKENMVKLPVIVYNHKKKEDVISSALELRQRLEMAAQQENEGNVKNKIRPIVLFQAEPKTKEDNATFEKIKAALLELKIPEEQIKIKTANKNELEKINLMDADCPVRYIITVNALKEGWDCPNAYILASLADRSSNVDVEQILGRVLRLPYVKKNQNAMLNMSYVFTASAKFSETLDNIVKGLNQAGFSSNDYRLANVAAEPNENNFTNNEHPQNSDSNIPLDFKPENLETQSEEIDISKIEWQPNSNNAPQENSPAQILQTEPKQNEFSPNNLISPTQNVMAEITKQAQEENKKMEWQAQNSTEQEPPAEVKKQMNTFKICNIFYASAQIKLPQFYFKNNIQSDLFGIKEEPFDKDMLLKNFPLRNADTNINFDAIDYDIRQIDLDENKGNTPTIYCLKQDKEQEILNWITNIKDLSVKRKSCAERLRKYIGDMSPISEKDILDYINRVLQDFDDVKLNMLLNTQSAYAQKIKEKINVLSNQYVKEQFNKNLDQEKIYLQESYSFKSEIHLSKVSKPLPKSLYERECAVNDFEERVIEKVANLENVEFWTRNIEKQGFCLNGFINHYPDFIVKTKKGKIILLETKGDHLDANDKIELGKKWAEFAGKNYRYALVYNERKVNGAYTLEEFLECIKEW